MKSFIKSFMDVTASPGNSSSADHKRMRIAGVEGDFDVVIEATNRLTDYNVIVSVTVVPTVDAMNRSGFSVEELLGSKREAHD